MSKSTIYREIKIPHPITLDNELIRSHGKKFYTVELKDRANVDSYAFENQKFIQEIISKFFKFNIKPNYMGYIEINLDTGNLHPHTDVHRYALNIVLEDQDAVTKFWTTTEKPQSIWAGSMNYDINKCQLIGEFKASTGSAWLYDLYTIHSVHGTANTRKLLTVRWFGDDFTFDQLYDSIEVL